MSWHRRGFVLALAANTACSRPAEEKSQLEEAAAAMVRPLYDRYLAPVSTIPALGEMAPWSDDLRAQLLAMEARATARNTPILEFDPFVHAQDWELTELVVTTESVVENSHATVRAHFINMGRADEVVFDLVWVDEWRVANMRGQDWNLREIVMPSEGPAAAP